MANSILVFILDVESLILGCGGTLSEYTNRRYVVNAYLFDKLSMDGDYSSESLHAIGVGGIYCENLEDAIPLKLVPVGPTHKVVKALDVNRLLRNIGQV